MEWDDLTEDTKKIMGDMGGFCPTSNVRDKTIKGYLEEGQCYMDSRDLRMQAEAMIEVAEWLERRAG